MDLACLCKGKARDGEVDCNCLLRPSDTVCYVPNQNIVPLTNQSTQCSPQNADNLSSRVMACAGFSAWSAFLPLSVW